MALDYVKEDLTRYIDQRNMTRIPADFQLVMFPHKGKQPSPFVDDINISNTPKRKADEILGYDPDSEIRWWFHPLIFADEIPLDSNMIEILADHSFFINSLCVYQPNFKEIYEKNKEAVKILSEVWNLPIQTFADAGIGKIGWGDMASNERKRMLTDAKKIARVLKSDFPELFGESGEADSTSGKFITDPPPPLEEKKGIMAKIKSISPKLGKKFSRKSSEEKMKL